MTIASTAERVVDSTSHFIERNKLAVRLTLTAVVASAVTASTILTYQASQRRKRSKALKEQLLQEAHTLQHSELTPLGTIAASNDSLSTGAQQVDFDESLIQEQLARNIAFLGEEGVQKVRQSLVVVVGAGSVGSWAALMLLRSGVQHLRIIDPRRLTGNNMAQHAVANVEDIGQYKVKALERHFREIAPFSRVVACTDRLTLMNMDALLGGQPAYVVDTMTHLDEKIALAQYCHQHNIKLISCMSVGAKADPTRIQISDISDSFGDPLTRAYRRRLKMLKIDRGIPVAHSIEKPNVPEGDDLGDFRTRRLPILGPIPSMLGMSIATYIILDLAEFSAMPAIPTRIRDNLYNRIIHDVTERETKVYKNKACPLDIHDAIYIFEEIWQAKSVLSGPQDRLTLTRWDRSKPMSYLNAVCMSRDEARAHDALPPDTDLREHYGDDVVDFVNKQFEQEECFQKLWK